MMESFLSVSIYSQDLHFCKYLSFINRHNIHNSYDCHMKLFFQFRSFPKVFLLKRNHNTCEQPIIYLYILSIYITIQNSNFYLPWQKILSDANSVGQPATSELLPGRKSFVFIETIRIPDAGPQCNAMLYLDSLDAEIEKHPLHLHSIFLT